MFARLQEFRCTHCEVKFIGAEINHCSYHTNEPSFDYGSSIGTYRCCNTQTTKFQSIQQKTHCNSKNHVIKASTPSKKNGANRAKNFELLLQHLKVACEPFYFDKHDIVTGEVERKIKYSDMIEEGQSLLNLVQAYIKHSPKYIQAKDKKEQEQAKLESKTREIEKQIIKQQKD